MIQHIRIPVTLYHYYIYIPISIYLSFYHYFIIILQAP